MSQLETISHEDKSNFLSDLILAYQFAGEYPTITSLLEKFSVNEAELRQLIFEDTNPKLIQRGYPPYKLEKRDPKTSKYLEPEFDPVFMLACERLLDTSSTKSFAARIKELEPLGITNATWTNWMKNEKMRTYASKLLKESFDENTNILADIGLAKLVAQGDLKAIQFYKTLTNRFNPQDQNTQNLSMMIGILLKIIAEKVKDPEIIEAIVVEFENTPVGQLNA